jgi:transcriptional regulator with XRE-family HTH domain
MDDEGSSVDPEGTRLRDEFHLLDPLSERARLLGEFIREQRGVARLSLRKLSDMANISNPYLSQIERGLRKPSAEILQQLAKALRISAETLYVQAGILDERTEAPDLARAIWDEPTLSEAQKRALVQVLRSFQAENRTTDSN